MFDFDKLQNAIEVLSRLSESVNPLSGEPLDAPILKDENVLEAFRYATEVLSSLIEKGEYVDEKEKPSDFDASVIDKSAVPLTDRNVGVTSLALRINKQVDKAHMKPLRPSSINDWLAENGYLSKEKVPVVRNVTKFFPTDDGSKMGIIEMEKINRSTGEVTTKLILSVSAQRFIIDHLDEIAQGNDSDDGDEQGDDSAD